MFPPRRSSASGVSLVKMRATKFPLPSALLPPVGAAPARRCSSASFFSSKFRSRGPTRLFRPLCVAGVGAVLACGGPSNGSCTLSPQISTSASALLCRLPALALRLSTPKPLLCVVDSSEPPSSVLNSPQIWWFVDFQLLCAHCAGK